MKHWQETTRIVDRILTVAESGIPAALGTVVHIEGSAYRRPGAKLLIEESGETLGGISGGCLEADVRDVAMQVLRAGRPRLRHYDTGSDEDTVWGLGLGCNGTVDVFVQPITTPDAIQTIEGLRGLLQGDAPFAVSTVIEGARGLGRMVSISGAGMDGSTGDGDLDRSVAATGKEIVEAGKSTGRRVDDHRFFFDVFLPPPWLLVFGAGDDAIPLVEIAAQVGFRPLVVDHRSGFLSVRRFPDAFRLLNARAHDDVATLPLGQHSYAVVMNHSLVHDREWVRHLLATEVRYVGLLGPRDRTEDILQQVDATNTDRVYGPVGLDLGADGPEQVALSVVSELLAVCSARQPRHLRDREGAIHAG